MPRTETKGHSNRFQGRVEPPELESRVGQVWKHFALFGTQLQAPFQSSNGFLMTSESRMRSTQQDTRFGIVRIP